MALSQSIIDKAAAILQEWGNEATFEMQKLLKQRLKQNAQVSDLAQSIDFTGSKVTTAGAIAIWNLNDYWVYVDLGVKGVQNRSRTYTSKDFPAGFRFKTMGVGTKMSAALYQYIVRKGIKVRQNKKESKASVMERGKQMANAMGRAIKKKGITGTRFYSDVFNDKGFKRLTDKLETALGQEIEVRIITALKI